MTVRLLLLRFSFALTIVCAAKALSGLTVDPEYPETGNYNLVTLSCRDDFGVQLNDAEFLKRIPGQESPLPLSDSLGSDITITLTPEEEGYFSCRSASENSTSGEIGLAGKLWCACVRATTDESDSFRFK